jgi:hypothetical protein
MDAATRLVQVSGPHAPSSTVRNCDVGGERLANDSSWWLVESSDHDWVGARGASCATHAGQEPVKVRKPRRGGGYADAVEAAAEKSQMSRRAS